MPFVLSVSIGGLGQDVPAAVQSAIYNKIFQLVRYNINDFGFLFLSNVTGAI